jgi:S-adenosylmethionine synthetase
MSKHLFTSESVSAGHPDKVADQISDALVQYIIVRDPKARVAIETLVKDNHVILAGELTTSVEVPFEEIVRKTVNDIGYNFEALGFNGNTLDLQLLIGVQSPDINMGVDRADGELGAGDQGIMFGIACDETPTKFPLAVTMAHALLHTLDLLRKAQVSDFLRPDAKSQVTLEYNDEGKVVGVDTIVISTQHSDAVTLQDLRQYIISNVIRPVLVDFGFGRNALVHAAAADGHTSPLGEVDESTPVTKILINPTGNFVIGGPVGDAGVTGRKIIVDTTGGYGRHGGGAFSGKDPSKVDRSAAYAARWAARNIVAAGLATKVEIQLSYAIGYAKPVSISVDTFGTAADHVTEDLIAQAVGKVFDFSPAGIIRDLQLLDPTGAEFSYQDTAAYGHFGRDNGNFPWEKENRVRHLLSALTELQVSPAAE